MTTLTHPTSHRPMLIVAPLAVALGALGGLAAGSGAFVGVGAVTGLLWAGLAALLARPLLRLRGTVAADVTALGAALVVALTFGAGLVQHVMYPTPEAYLSLMRSPASGGATGLYMVLNPLVEWLLMPAALALGWHHPRRRRLLLAAATVYYLQRLTTYLYFAPTVLSWAHGGTLAAVGLWINLDLARMALDLAVVTILSTAVITRKR
ncbi:hypothetical protein [Nonomuraea sp. SYSU D8015]|uniref:hypothetical protein n=1 Tax=Nonomuraea sp. SYSU D8015 TaxID=2593644 RepID=UPI0016601B32|nr:hypothetical protein [Nonomuraea sp. SYSU D8015]